MTDFKDDVSGITGFTQILEPTKEEFDDTRKRRIIENIAEMEYRKTLSKRQLEKMLEYNMSSPIKKVWWNNTAGRSDLNLSKASSLTRLNRDLKNVADFVHDIIRPVPDPSYEEIRTKPSTLMNERELELVQLNLREELKRANGFLTRLVDK